MRKQDSISRYRNDEYLYNANARRIMRADDATLQDSAQGKGGGILRTLTLVLKYVMMALLLPFYLIYLPLMWLWEKIENLFKRFAALCERIYQRVTTTFSRILEKLSSSFAGIKLRQIISAIRRLPQTIEAQRERLHSFIRNSIIQHKEWARRRLAGVVQRYNHFNQRISSIPDYVSQLYQEAVSEIRRLLSFRSKSD